MQLQQFVTEVIEELGGVVDPVEYALCQVLIPETYASYFQNKTELELSFDFEVAQENPESEFITFGSYVFEQLLSIVQQKATSTLRFAELERLELGNPLKKLTEFLKDEPGKISILEEKPVLGAWAVFQYHLTYIADEKFQDNQQVWVNLLTNEISLDMKLEQNRIVYKQEPIYTLPLAAPINMNAALEEATKYVSDLSEQYKNEQSPKKTIEKDIDRITNYYKELLSENEKRATRKGLSEEKKAELAAKSEAIELERGKQLQEIYNKYNGHIEMNLDNGILYFIPLLQYHVEIHLNP